jgi:hypothetical protein
MSRTTIGSLEAIKDAVRDVGWESRLESIWQDVRHACRGLRRSPGFAAVATLTLALGTGANTAIFTLIDALLLRSLPVANPEQLVQLTMVLPIGATWQSFSYPLVRGLADRRDIFTSLAGFSGGLFDIGPPAAMETTPGAWVTGRYYETLGVRAAAGRLLTADDDRPGASPVVVISDGYWRRKFGRDLQVIGQRLIIGRSSATIIGVSQPGFEGATVGEAADLTLPIGVLPQVSPERAEGLEASSTWLRVLARPREDMSAIQTKAFLTRAWPAVATSAIPADIPIALRRALASTLDVRPGATGWSPLRDQFRSPLLVLMAFVAVVLLIACVNVANLLLARTASRHGEITVRLAIGGRRSRIVRQLLIENAVLALLGAGLGMLFAQAGCRLLVSSLSSGRAQEVALNLIPNGHVLAFTSAVAMATSLLFAIGSNSPPWEIIGVAADVVYESMRDRSRPTVYMPYLQMPGGPVSFEAAVAGAQAPVAAALQGIVQSKLPGVRVTVRTLTSQVERSLITERLLATLAGAFGALALLLAVVGVYGLLTYSVTLRTGEIGIRMALGACRAQVLRLVLGEILAFTAVGMVIGLCAAAIGARALETMLFGLSALDPVTFVAVAVIFGATAMIAALPPARRAISIDPMIGLRCE